MISHHDMINLDPAPESVAHTVNDSVSIDQLVQAAALYAAFPNIYRSLNSRGLKPPMRQGAKQD
jgi:hypothetical protein